MSHDSVFSGFRSLAIFTAFAFAFYFLLVWNPLGTFGDIRTYLEHRVRVPIEWTVAAIPLAWLIHRNSGYTAAAAFLFPIFAVILALTTLNYGAAFWRIFRHEVYLAPVYAPRGLLVCFLLLSLVVFPRRPLTCKLIRPPFKCSRWGGSNKRVPARQRKPDEEA